MPALSQSHWSLAPVVAKRRGLGRVDDPNLVCGPYAGGQHPDGETPRRWGAASSCGSPQPPLPGSPSTPQAAHGRPRCRLLAKEAAKYRDQTPFLLLPSDINPPMHKPLALVL